MTKLEIEGRVIEVGEGFKDLSPEEQERTVEEIASSLRLGGSGNTGPKHPVMSQVNRGIADAVGGTIDFLNPFDKPHALNPFSGGTGSAETGIQDLMKSGGIEVAEGDPDGMMQGFFRGAGEAAGSMPAVAAGAGLVSKAGGAIGRLGADALGSLATRTAPLAEMLAGGISGGARSLAEDAGAPDWVQNTAAIVAPMSIPAAGASVGAIARNTPVGRIAGEAAKSVKAAAMPYTKTGATEVASRRLVGLAGGADRADELSKRIGNDNPLNLTPAQQTDDPNMLAVEQLAAAQDPELRSRLESREKLGRGAAVDEIDVPGDIGDTRSFFDARRREFAEKMRAEADDAIQRTQKGVDWQTPVRTEAENAVAVSQRIKARLDDATMQERALWDAVPKDAQVRTDRARSVAQSIIDSTPRAQRNDIPKIASELLYGEGGFGGVETVSEMHGLYSELRRVARSAMAGNDKNKNLARISNELADAILDDLGAFDGASEVGRTINEARAFSAALHETFDQGEVGRLLKKTLDGDMSVAPELSLQRTVARPGVAGAVASRDIEAAAPETEVFIRDFIRGQFQDAAASPTGDFTSANARTFLRRNGPLLDRYPELRDDIVDAVRTREDASAFAARVESRLADLQKTRLSAGAALLDGPPADAIKAFKNAKNPVRQARLLVNEAAKDESGKALSGLKSLLADELIKKPTGEGIEAALGDPKLKAAFRVVFTPAEISRMRKIGRELAKLDRAQQAAPSIGDSLAGGEVSKMIEFPARILAARHGANLGGGGGASIQTAGMASDRVKAVLGRLVKDRASQMLADAVEDPDLFRLLLSNVKTPEAEAKFISRALPYLVGGAATSEQ